MAGLREDTYGRHRITDALRCSWGGGRAFDWQSKTAVLTRRDEIGSRAIVRTTLDRTGGAEAVWRWPPRLPMQWRKRGTKHKNSRARRGVPGVAPADGARSDPGPGGRGRPEQPVGGAGSRRAAAAAAAGAPESGGLTPGGPRPARRPPRRRTAACCAPTGRWRWRTPPPACPSTSAARAAAWSLRRSPGDPRAAAART